MELWELGQIAKAQSKTEKKRAKKMRAAGYRRSHLTNFNPRSETWVKPGAASAARRIGGQMLGSAAGQTVGGIAGGAAGGSMGAQLGATAGGLLGASAGATRNIRSKDTVSFNRSTGKKARGKAVTSFGTYNLY